MSNEKKIPAEELFKDYKPVVVEYDPEVDGDDEHLLRDDLLSEKERLHELINARKQANRGERRVRR